MKRFFLLSDLSGDYDFEEFSSEEEVLSAIQESVDFARTWPDGAEWFDRLVWGEIRGTVGEDGQLTPVPPDPEAERLRAELAAFRARVAAVLAALQDMEAHHRKAGNSLAHGDYDFERAEAYEHASDLLKEALNEQPNDGRACPVGGEK